MQLKNTQPHKLGRISNPVFIYKDNSLECFESAQRVILKIYNSEMITLAARFVNWLENSMFLCWFKFYSEIITHIDIYLIS